MLSDAEKATWIPAPDGDGMVLRGYPSLRKPGKPGQQLFVGASLMSASTGATRFRAFCKCGWDHTSDYRGSFDMACKEHLKNAAAHRDDT